MTHLTSQDEQVIEYNPVSVKVSGGPANSIAHHVMEAICRRIVEIEPKLTEVDRICGDGDCGVVIDRGPAAYWLVLQPTVGVDYIEGTMLPLKTVVLFVNILRKLLALLKRYFGRIIRAYDESYSFAFINSCM
jgi:hypothetical protein